MPSIFSRIVSREIPAHIVYEDDLCIAFLDINPVAWGHTLVIPKQEIQRLQDCPDDMVSHLFIVAKKIMIAMKQSLGADFVHVGVMGTEVPHTHIHVIPLCFDTLVSQRPTMTYPDDTVGYYHDTLRDAIKEILGDPRS